MSVNNASDIVADPMIPVPYRIVDYTQDLSDTFTITLVPEILVPETLVPETLVPETLVPETLVPETLVPEDIKAKQQFLPGQFNMLYVFGVGEAPISISGDTGDGSLLVHTIKAVGAVTKAIQTLRPGDVVGMRGPFGQGWPVEKLKGKDCIIVAGGLGLAPLRPVIYEIIHNRQDYGRVSLLCGSRSPKRILYRDEMNDWKKKGDINVQITVDWPDCETEENTCWDEGIGPVTNLIAKETVNPPDTFALMCGPEIMMWYSALALEKRGLDKSNIYLSLERNMRCAIGHCGHCQWGPRFICKDGPVLCYEEKDIETFLSIREF